MRRLGAFAAALGVGASALTLSACATTGDRSAVAEWAFRSAGAVVCTPPDRRTDVPLGRVKSPSAEVSLVIQCVPPGEPQ